MRSSPDRSRAKIKRRGFAFEPFRPTDAPLPLSQLDADPREELLVFERSGERRAVVARQMAYHHTVQGDLAGEPYLVSF